MGRHRVLESYSPKALRLIASTAFLFICTSCSNRTNEVPLFESAITSFTKGGATHVHAFPSDRTAAILLKVQHDNADVTVGVLAANGEVVGGARTASKRHGTMRLCLVAANYSKHTISIQNRNSFASSGKYWVQGAQYEQTIPELDRITCEADALSGSNEKADQESAAAKYRHLLSDLGVGKNDAIGGDIAYNLAALFYYKLRDWQQAANYAADAQMRYSALGMSAEATHSKSLRAAALMEAALLANNTAENSIDRFSQAETLLSQSRSEHQKNRNHFDAALDLNNIGLIHFYRGSGDAQIHFRQAEAEFAALDEAQWRLIAMQNCATSQTSLGDYRNASQTFAELQKQMRPESHWTADDWIVFGDVVHNSAVAFEQLGKHRDAMAHYVRASEIHQSRDNSSGYARALRGLAATYYKQGDVVRAIEILEQTLPVSRSSRDGRGIFAALELLGRYSLEVGDPKKALRYHTEALTFSQNPYNQARVDFGLALDYEALKDFRVADSYFEKALAAKISPSSPAFVSILIARGRSLIARGDAQASPSFFERALTNSQGVGYEVKRAQAHYGLALAYKAIKQESRASDHLQKAMHTVRSQLAATLTPSLRAAHVAARREIYQTEIEWLLSQSIDGKGALTKVHAVDALLAVENARAISLKESIGASVTKGVTANGSRSAISGDQARRTKELATDIAGKLARLETLNDRENTPQQTIQILELDVARLRAEYELTQNANRKSATQASSFDRNHLTNLQKALPLGTTVVEYHLGKKQSWAWRITAENIDVVQLANAAVVERAVNAAVAALSKPKSESAAYATGNDLHSLLIEPIIKGRSIDRLIVVPDGVMNRIPINALNIFNLAGTKPIIAMAPTLTLLERGTKSISTKASILNIAVFADPAIAADADNPHLPPPLRGARAEATAINAIGSPLNVSVYEGANASVERFNGLNFDALFAVHIAAHGYTYESDPELSYLQLAGNDKDDVAHDGQLLLTSIRELNISTPLIVLSACDTANGKDVWGDGTQGFAHAFFQAGSNTIVASKWKVPDESTAKLMELFYTHISKGNDPQAALHLAQIQIAKTPKWKHPYFWAGFAVYTRTIVPSRTL